MGHVGLPLGTPAPIAGVLAQARVAPLPSPPLVDRLFLESPLPVVAALVLGAVTAFAVLNRRGMPGRGVAIAGVLALAAGAVMVLAMLVQTPREQLTAATRDLVDAVATVDTPALERLLADDFRFHNRLSIAALAVPAAGLDKPSLIALVEQEMDGPFAVKEHGVLQTQAVMDGPAVGRTQVRVRVVPESLGYPNASWWRIDWRRGPQGWRVIGVEPLAIEGVSR